MRLDIGVLKVEHAKPLSSVALKFNLRRYIKEADALRSERDAARADAAAARRGRANAIERAVDAAVATSEGQALDDAEKLKVGRCTLKRVDRRVLRCDKLLSEFAFSSNLRRCIKEEIRAGDMRALR